MLRKIRLQNVSALYSGPRIRSLNARTTSSCKVWIPFSTVDASGGPPRPRNNTQIAFFAQRQTIISHQNLASSTAATETKTNASDSVSSEAWRPWLDPHRSLENRVTSFVQADRIPPGAFAAKETVEFVTECCKEKSLQGMQWAHDIVDRLMVEKRRFLTQQGVFVTIPEKVLNSVMYGWAVRAAKNKVAQYRMKELLQMIVSEALEDIRAFEAMTSTDDDDERTKLELGPGQKGGPLLSEPTVQIFNTYLRGVSFAANSSPRISEQCPTVLEDMIKYQRTHGWHTLPNTRSFTHAISAYSNSARIDSGQNALRILRWMQKEHEAQKKVYFEEYGVPYDVKNPDSNRRIIVTPDIVAYTTTISAMVRSIRDASEAIALLQTVLQTEGLTPDPGIFAIVIHAFARLADKGKNAYTRLSAAKNAEEVLGLMVRKLVRDDQKKLDTSSSQSKDLLIGFNACLDAWSKSYLKESAPKCEELLQTMLAGNLVEPNTISFNSCLYAWSKSYDFYPDAANRAEDLLALQHELCASGDLSKDAMPDFRSYAIAILAHAHSDDPEKAVRARALLEKLLGYVKSHQMQVTRNPSAPFTAVLSAVARSPPNLLSDNVGLSSDDGFNSVFDSTKDTFGIAEMTYRELKEDSYGIGASPDHHAFGAFLRCIAQHTAPSSAERENKGRMVFDDACEAGEVSRLVVENLKVVVGESMFNIPELEEKQLPLFWTRNVPRPFRYKPQSRRRYGE